MMRRIAGILAFFVLLILFFRSFPRHSGRRDRAPVDPSLSRIGVDPARLEAKGYGASMPVAPNDTAENKAQNRRAELVRLAR